MLHLVQPVLLCRAMTRNRRTQPAGERLVCMHARPPRSPTTNERAHRGPLPLPPLSSARLGLSTPCGGHARTCGEPSCHCLSASRPCVKQWRGAVVTSRPSSPTMRDRQQPQPSRTYTLQILPPSPGRAGIFGRHQSVPLPGLPGAAYYVLRMPAPASGSAATRAEEFVPLVPSAVGSIHPPAEDS